MVNTKFVLPSYEGEELQENHPVNIGLCTNLVKDCWPGIMSSLHMGRSYRIIFNMVGERVCAWTYPNNMKEIRDKDYDRIIKMFGC